MVRKVQKDQSSQQEQDAQLAALAMMAHCCLVAVERVSVETHCTSEVT
jgi:hypothetical protein